MSDVYETGELPEFHDIVDAIIAWSDEILNWHCADRASNGRIEGTNNLLQVLRRTAHGFTNPRNFEARGLLVTQSPQPVPATPHPTLTRRAMMFACGYRAVRPGWRVGLPSSVEAPAGDGAVGSESIRMIAACRHRLEW